MSPLVRLERIAWDAEAGEVELRSKAGADDEAGGGEIERLDADEFVARVIVQVPDARRHLVRNYGYYANAARAKREKDAAASATGEAAVVAAARPTATPRTERDPTPPNAARRDGAGPISFGSRSS